MIIKCLSVDSGQGIIEGQNEPIHGKIVLDMTDSIDYQLFI